MAFTATKLYQFNNGNKIQIAYTIAADAASGSIQTGLKVVESCYISPVSCTTNAQNVKSNATVGSTVALGSVFISSCATTDVFTLTVIGH